MAEASSDEVRVKLVVDDVSASTREDVIKGFEAIRGSVASVKAPVDQLKAGVDHVKLSFEGSAKAADDFIKKMAGVKPPNVSEHKEEHKSLFASIGDASLRINEMVEVAHKIAEPFKKAAEFAIELGKEAFGAANAAEMQTRAMSNLMGMMGHGAHSMAEIKTYAEGIREELEGTAIKTGMSMADTTDIFNSIIARGGVSTEKAKELTEQMSMVGRVIPGGASALAQAFDGLEMGMIRARSPLAQLISSTGVLKGTAADVAKQMQHMTQEERMKKATEAINKQATSMSAAGGPPPSMAIIKGSLDTMKESFLESMGKPLLEHLLPPLNAVRMFLVAHIDEIKDFGERVGSYMAQGIDMLSAAFGGVYSAVKEGWGELESALKSAGHISNESKAELSKTFKDMTKDLIEGAKWVINAVKSAADFVKDSLSELDKLDRFVGNLTGDKSVGDNVRLSSTEQKTVSGVQSAAGAIGAGTQGAFDESADAYRRVALEAGRSNEEIDNFITKLQTYRDETQKSAESVKAAADASNVDAFGTYMNQAIANNNDSTLNYAISILQGNSVMQHALADGTIKVEGGFDDFIRMLKDKSPELAKQLKDMANPIKAAGGIQGGRGITFNGGQKFEIKQSFAHEDADRIAMIFRRDIAKAAEARVQSRMSTFGGFLHKPGLHAENFAMNKDESRFWSKIVKCEDGCWNYIGTDTGHGYGSFKAKGKTWRAHIYAFYIAHHRMPIFSLRHTCGNKRCMRIDHIYEELSPEDRFWQYVYKSSDCWIWNGNIQNKGYGVYGADSQTWLAHRYSFFIANNREPGPLLMHLCNTPPCVNPSHLIEGTHKQNTNDAIRDGLMLVGEMNGQSKLTECDVGLIRNDYSAGKSQAFIANKYGVSQGLINLIVRGIIWKHVGGSITEKAVEGGVKLNNDLVKEIRDKWACGVRQAQMSRDYNVSAATMHNVVHGKTWKPSCI